MIEVTLALLVVALGVISIFGLVPYGAKAHRDAIHNNCSADAVSEILNYLAIQVRHDDVAWNNYAKGTYLAVTPPNISDPNQFPGDIKSPSGIWNDPGNRWQPVAGTHIYVPKNLAGPPLYIPNVFRICDTSVIPPVSGGGGKAREVTDFDAIIRVWKSTSWAWEHTGGGFSDTEDATYEKRIVLNAEVMWPASPAADDPTNGYNQRRHARYALEVCR